MSIIANSWSALRRFFADPFERGMTLFFVAHILTLILLVPFLLEHNATSQARITEIPPQDAFTLGFVLGVAVMLPAVDILGLGMGSTHTGRCRRGYHRG